jgi:hypothetical protein
VFARVPKVLVVLALASSIGLHWAFLQAVAWAGMVITYSYEGPVTEAVVKTFDGNHPCGLCKQIEKSKRTEKRTEYNFEFGKVKFPYAPMTFIFNRPPWFYTIPPQDFSADLLAQAPPVPPPRSFIA